MQHNVVAAHDRLGIALVACTLEIPNHYVHVYIESDLEFLAIDRAHPHID